MSTENEKNSNSNLKNAVIVLGLISLLGGGFFIKSLFDIKIAKEKLNFANDEKSKIMVELVKINADYNKAINDNSSKAEELKVERQKIVDLINELNSAKTTIASLNEYRRKVQFYEAKIVALNQEIINLKIENAALQKQRDSSLIALKEMKVGTTAKDPKIAHGPNGFNNNNKIESTKKSSMSNELAEKLYKIDIVNLNVQAIKNINNKEVPVTKTAEVEYIKVAFTIPQSFIIKASERNYYIQIVSPDNSILGDNQSITFEDKAQLSYSFLKKIDYKNRVLPVFENLKFDNLKKGKYSVKVFDKSRLVGITNFNLI